MHFEIFAVGDSYLHKLDPRGKILSSVVFSVLVSSMESIEILMEFLCVSIVVVLIAKLPFFPFLKRLLTINIFVFFLWLILPWKLELSVDSMFKVNLDREGLFLAKIITLKVNTIAMGLISFLSTNPTNKIFHALAHFKVPDKFLYLLFFFYRYLYLLHKEYHRLNLALKARGFIPKNNFHTYSTYAYLAGMTLINSNDRAERIYQAMICRGFNGTYWLLNHFSWRKRDIIFLFIFHFILLCLLGKHFLWN